MKKSVILFATACLATTAFAKPPKVTYDKFQQTTTIIGMTSDPVVAGARAVIALVVFKGRQITELDMETYALNEGWEFLKCHDIYWLVDDKPMGLGPGHYDGSVLSAGLVSEHIVMHPTLAQFDKLGAAKSIEYKICNEEQSIDAAGIKNIKDFVTELHAQLDGTSTANPTP